MKCSFCGSEIKKGTGIMYARADGNIYNFCRRRCKEYMLMKKDPRKFKWAAKSKSK